MLDAPKIVRELLTKTGTALYSHVGTRVYSPMAPSSFRNTEKAIVFQVSGGARDFTLDIASVTVDVMCFGGNGTVPSWAKAEEVHHALLSSVMGNANANAMCASGWSLSVDEVMTGQQVVQKETQYPYVWVVFEIELAAL